MGNVNTNQLNAVKNVLDHGEAVDFYKGMWSCSEIISYYSCITT